MELLGQKQLKVGDARIFTIDYSAWLLSNETVTAAVATVGPATSPPLAVTADIAVDGKSVSVEISGGVANTQYTVQVTATTTIDNSPNPNGSQTRVDCFGIDMYGECVA